MNGCSYKYKYVLFDLDGTLTNSQEGIVNSVIYALRKMGYDLPKKEELLSFIGPPLRDSFKKYCNMDGGGAEAAVKLYRERYSKKGLYELSVYEGVYETLEKITERGQIAVIATSKPEGFTKKILEKTELAKYFSLVVGSELDGTRDRKSEVIEEALRLLGEPDRKDVIMVGDTHFDVEGAMINGISCIGVTYGFAKDGELINAGAVSCVEHFSDLLKII